MTLEEGKKKKKLFGSLFSSCFGGKSQVAEKPEVQEQAKPKQGADKPAEEDPAKDEPEEDKTAEEKPTEEEPAAESDEKEEWIWGLQLYLWKHTVDKAVRLFTRSLYMSIEWLCCRFQVAMLKLFKLRI